MPSLLDRALDWMVFPGYDATGYRLRSLSWDASDTDVDLTGKIALVTGANQGIGRATTEALFRRGAAVHMVCRNEQRGRQSMKEILSDAGSIQEEEPHDSAAIPRKRGGQSDVRENSAGQLVLHTVDVSDREGLVSFLERFRSENSHLDILVNNAGVLLDERQEAPDGLEMTFAVNVRAPFLINETLFPLLKESSDARVIQVSSGGMYLAPIHFDDLLWQKRRFDGVMAYAETKRGEILLSIQWSKIWKDTNIKVNSMHPGWADTHSVKQSLPLFRTITAPFLRSAEQGADTIVYLACKPDLSTSGAFYCDREIRPVNRMKKTELTEEQIADYYELVRKISLDAGRIQT